MTIRTPPAGGAVTLDVSLLGREYRVACNESERAALIDAVALLDRRMREIRDGGKVAGSERIAVMAALNLAHELLNERRAAIAPSSPGSPSGIDDAGLRRRIVDMQTAIDQVLAGPDKAH